MAVKRKTIRFVPFSGVDQKYKAELGNADSIVNMRVDPYGLGWVADRGLEPWWEPDTNVSIIGNAATQVEMLANKVDSCYVWTKKSTKQTYYIIEQAGKLFYFLGNKNGGGYLSDLYAIDYDRTQPSGDDIGTQYIPWKDSILIINGIDDPIWFDGKTARSFGFRMNGSDVDPLPIEPDYYDSTRLTGGTAAPAFNGSEHLGLGDPSGVNFYSYKISRIRDTGAESPMSPVAATSWAKDPNGAAPDLRFGVVLTDIENGEEGTVAWRLYRTKNQKTVLEDGAPSDFYFVKQIKENSTDIIIDVIPDGDLVDPAPSQSDSVLISGRQRVGAVWDSRMWLAEDDRIIYSLAGIPEQFAASNYIDIGNTEGGAITGLHAYYNNLLVFQEKSISIIRRSSSGYLFNTIYTGTGTTATNTIKTVPNVGVLFLAKDGIYRIVGGVDGGSQISVKKISHDIDRQLRELSHASIEKSIAGYSPKEEEYWVHYPANGTIVPNKGVVLHTGKGVFSFRHADTEANEDLFRFSAMTIDKDGSFIFGTSPVWKDPFGNAGSPVLAGHMANLSGHLYVWSSSPTWGKSWTTTAPTPDVTTYSTQDIALPKASYESSWYEIEGNDIKHRVLSVEVEYASYGDNKLQLSYAKDYDSNFTIASAQKQNMPETLYTTQEDPVFGADDNTVSKNFFKLGQTTLNRERLTRVRFDVSTGLINFFKFRLEMEGTQTPFHIVSFHINYNTSHQQTLNTRR